MEGFNILGMTGFPCLHQRRCIAASPMESMRPQSGAPLMTTSLHERHRVVQGLLNAGVEVLCLDPVPALLQQC